MKKLLVAMACAAFAGLAATPAHAQKEAMGAFYQMQMAPKVCGWKGAASPAKLDAKIADMEKGMSVSASEKATMMKAAEAELKSDPSNCAADGMMAMMYAEAVK